MLNGALFVLAHIVDLDKRLIFYSMLSGIYGIALVAGPLAVLSLLTAPKNVFLILL
jgi:hypothetical protein